MEGTVKDAVHGHTKGRAAHGAVRERGMWLEHWSWKNTRFNFVATSEILPPQDFFPRHI